MNHFNMVGLGQGSYTNGWVDGVEALSWGGIISTHVIHEILVYASIQCNIHTKKTVEKRQQFVLCHISSHAAFPNPVQVHQLPSRLIKHFLWTEAPFARR